MKINLELNFYTLNNDIAFAYNTSCVKNNIIDQPSTPVHELLQLFHLHHSNS